MSFLHFYNSSRFLSALILVLPLMACSSGDSFNSSNTGTGFNLDVPSLSWVAPSAREDGTGMSLSEIAGFRVYYGAQPGDYSDTIEINDHTVVQLALASIPAGTYYVAISTVDTGGRESALSSEVVVTQ